MLTKKQVEYFYYLQTLNFINKDHSQVHRSGQFSNYLIDQTPRIIGVAKYSQSVKSVRGIDQHLSAGLDQSLGVQFGSSVSFIKNRSWLTKLNYDKKWVEDYNIENEDTIYRYILSNQKLYLLDIIYDEIENIRKLILPDILGQSEIYSYKITEARTILEKGIEQDNLGEYPYTIQYSQLMDIPIKEAAKRILLQHQINSENIAYSEEIRLRYQEIVVKENDISNLAEILKSFKSETFGNII